LLHVGIFIHANQRVFIASRIKDHILNIVWVIKFKINFHTETSQYLVEMAGFIDINACIILLAYFFLVGVIVQELVYFIGQFFVWRLKNVDAGFLPYCEFLQARLFNYFLIFINRLVFWLVFFILLEGVFWFLVKSRLRNLILALDLHFFCNLQLILFRVIRMHKLKFIVFQITFNFVLKAQAVKLTFLIITWAIFFLEQVLI
jgi:hypothetical protein